MAKTNVNAIRTNIKSGTKTINCACKSTFQDAAFGKGVRAANITAKGARCTVCGSTK